MHTHSCTWTCLQDCTEWQYNETTPLLYYLVHLWEQQITNKAKQNDMKFTSVFREKSRGRQTTLGRVIHLQIGLVLIFSTPCCLFCARFLGTSTMSPEHGLRWTFQVVHKIKWSMDHVLTWGCMTRNIMLSTLTHMQLATCHHSSTNFSKFDL
jgi:hypothetical protein